MQILCFDSYMGAFLLYTTHNTTIIHHSQKNRKLAMTVANFSSLFAVMIISDIMRINHLSWTEDNWHHSTALDCCDQTTLFFITTLLVTDCHQTYPCLRWVQQSVAI